jgi:hypothetical protein
VKPACWSSAENWVEWERLNHLTGALSGCPIDHFCADCLPEFKAAACGAGRCAYPDVTFSIVLERRRDPVTQKMQNIQTAALRGCRNEADEASWKLRHQVREAESGQK